MNSDPCALVEKIHSASSFKTSVANSREAFNDSSPDKGEYQDVVQSMSPFNTSKPSKFTFDLQLPLKTLKNLKKDLESPQKKNQSEVIGLKRKSFNFAKQSESSGRSAKKFMPLKRRSTVSLTGNISDLKGFRHLNSLKKIGGLGNDRDGRSIQSSITTQLKADFKRILKNTNLSEECKKQVPNKTVVTKCLSCFLKIAELPDFLPDYFHNFHDIFKNLLDYFDSIKHLLEIIRSSAESQGYIDPQTNKREEHHKADGLEDETETEGDIPKMKKYEDAGADLSSGDMTMHSQQKEQPYFEQIEKYIEGLTGFIEKFQQKERVFQEKLSEFEVQLEIKDELINKFQRDLDHLFK